MTKLFNNIRKKLINDKPSASRTINYLKYAIGEIVLVVIGILIALSINTWNESRKEKGLEILCLKNATYLTARKTFVITDPTYTDLISSGNINILKNQTYKDKLLKYYQELERVEKVIQNNNSLLIDQHYIQSFMEIGYYYSTPFDLHFTDLSDIEGDLTLPRYETNIQDISKKVISKKENKLALMNAINFRQNLAIAHYGLLKNIKSITKSLINELEMPKH